MQRTDSDLVEAACAGDIDSFRVLYERYYSMAVGIARSRLSDHHLAEDAAQEAFATACRRLPALKDATRFPRWLRTICRRTASQMGRRTNNDSTLKHEPAARDGCETEMNATRVREAVNGLSASAREVIQLHYFSGLSYAEIGHALGISPDAVHGRMQRARRKLAHQLTKFD